MWIDLNILIVLSYIKVNTLILITCTANDIQVITSCHPVYDPRIFCSILSIDFILERYMFQGVNIF